MHANDKRIKKNDKIMMHMVQKGKGGEPILAMKKKGRKKIIGQKKP